jgi:flavin reductase (DIM6/NTAB) family NADH-FMN oxidoreductase RutF
MSLICERGRTHKGSVIGHDVFKDAMAVIPSAVTIVTSWAEDGAPAGATLSAVTALSLEPALMLACFDHKSETLKAIRASESFLIHVLADGQQDLARCFSRRCDTKFNEVAWKAGLMALPQLEGCAVTIACWLFQSLPGGDHTIIIGEIAQIETAKASGPLVYAHRKLHPLSNEVNAE